MINLAEFEARAHRGELEPADVVQAYNRIMELDQINSTVKRRAKDLARRREARQTVFAVLIREGHTIQT